MGANGVGALMPSSGVPVGLIGNRFRSRRLVPKLHRDSASLLELSSDFEPRGPDPSRDSADVALVHAECGGQLPLLPALGRLTP